MVKFRNMQNDMSVKLREDIKKQKVTSKILSFTQDKNRDKIGVPKYRF